MQQQFNLCFSCKKPFKTPKNLPHFLPNCGHSLCTKCLINLLQSSKNAFPVCPLCFQEFSSIDLQDFPVNLQIMPQKTQEIAEAPSTLCKKHSRSYEAFCKIEKKPICLSCLLDNSHRFHEIIPLKDAISQEKSKILGFLEETRILKKKYQETLLESLEKQKKLLCAAYDENLREIREFFAKLHEILNEKQIEIEKEVGKEFSFREKTLETRENAVKNAINFIQEYEEQFEEVKKRKDFEILTWSLEKEQEIEEIKGQVLRKVKEKSLNLAGFWKKHEKIEKIYREMGDIFREVREIDAKNKGFLGKIKVKGKENWSASQLKSIENLHNRSQTSAMKTKVDDNSFLIEEQKKFHLKMLTFT